MWKAITMTRDLLPEAAAMAEEFYTSENDIANVDYLDAEYYHNPAGEVRMLVAWDEENHCGAGQYAAIPIKIKVGDETVTSLMSVNTLVRPDYQGQGIFKGLATQVYSEAAEAGYSFVYGMPNQNSYPGFLKYVGFRDLGAVPLYLRPMVPSGMVRSYLKNNLLTALARPFNPLFNPVCRNNTVQFAEFNETADRYADEFWKGISAKYSVMICRDYEYMKFRFINLPRRDYVGFYAISNDKPVAFALGRVMEVAGISCGMVADFLFLPGYEKEASAVLRKLLVSLKESGGEMAGCMVPATTGEAKLLRKAGFFKCPTAFEPQPFRFIYRELAGSSELASNELGNWFFTMGDYDVV